MVCFLNLILSLYFCFCFYVVLQVFFQYYVIISGLIICFLCLQERDGMRVILGFYDSELIFVEYSFQLIRRMREVEDMVQKVYVYSSEMEVSVVGCLFFRLFYYEVSGYGFAVRRGGLRRGCGGFCYAQIFSFDLRSIVVLLSYYKYGCINSYFVITFWFRVKR